MLIEAACDCCAPGVGLGGPDGFDDDNDDGDPRPAASRGVGVGRTALAVHLLGDAATCAAVLAEALFLRFGAPRRRRLPGFTVVAAGSRHRRGHDLDSPWGLSRGGVAAPPRLGTVHVAVAPRSSPSDDPRRGVRSPVAFPQARRGCRGVRRAA